MKLRRHFVIYGLVVALVAALLTWHSPPVRSQSGTSQMIESDDPTVARIGTWTSQSASQASDGSYLYNSPSPLGGEGQGVGTMLSLQFSGPSIEVLYVTGPSLGTLAIEVDGTVLRTVITAADETRYGQVAKIDYLTDEAHTLKVYAQEGGVVGIDAFVVPNVTNTPAEVETYAAPRNTGWMATYVQRFPLTSCSIPTLNLSSLPSGSMRIPGSFPVSDINFDWGSSSGPVQVAPTTDYFAIQFERTLNFSQDTTLAISYMADDAIRIYDNGGLIVDRWGCHSATPMLRNYTFSVGDHNIVIQYVEITGPARITVTFSVPLLIATPQSASEIALSWSDTLINETNYRVERLINNNWTEIATLQAGTTSYTDTNLACNTTYQYRVRGYFSGTATYSGYSNIADALTGGCITGTPTNLMAEIVDYTQMQLTWVDNAADETEYRIEMSHYGYTWQQIGTAPANATTYTQNDLDCEQNYTYRVRAYRSGDDAFSEYSNTADATTIPCFFVIMPVNLTATPLDDGQIRLDWSDYTEDETEFRVERSPNGTSDWVEIGIAPANTETYTNVSLICNMAYYYRVRAYRVPFTAFSDYSNVANATTATCPANCEAAHQRIQRLSVGMDGGAPDNDVLEGRRSLSDDGRYAVFSSYADNLVASETTWSQVFLFDRMTCQTTLISSDLPSNMINWSPSVSGDGRYILFESGTHDPVPSPTNLFLHDRLTGTTVLVSNSIDDPTVSSGFWGMLSGNGRYVAFVSELALIPTDTNNVVDVYVRDLQSNTLEIASLTTSGAIASNVSAYPYISYDGQYVTFISAANLVSEDTAAYDVYIRDMVNDTVRLVSYSDDETVHWALERMSHQEAFRWPIYAPVTSDGRYIAFVSAGLTANEPQGVSHVYVRDVLNGTTTLASVEANGNSFVPSISDDGRYIVFSSDANNFVVGDTNYHTDVYMYDSFTETISWLSQTFDGGVPIYGSAVPYITPDGRYVSFYSGATNLLSEGGYPGMVLVEPSLSFAPGSLVASATGRDEITLNWSDANADETEFHVEQSLNGTSWTDIATLPSDTTQYMSQNLACGTAYHYRVRVYRASDMTYSPYSNVANTTTAGCLPDALAIVNPATRSANLVHTLTNPPAGGDYTQFATGFPYGTGGQYLTGDWNGDGLETLGVYRGGAFFFTNDYGTGGTWGGVWFGLGGQPVAGRFDANVGHDCLGVTDSGTWQNGDLFFALYFTCNLDSGATPPLTFQWLSILLPNSQGFTGTYQFVAGDFDGDGLDSIAVRRGNFIAWTNVPPTTVYSAFQYAQYIGAPGTGDEGKIVVGDWDLNTLDSFGLVYQNGTFYRRNDLDWNSGAYTLQQFTPLVGTPFDVASWRPN